MADFKTAVLITIDDAHEGGFQNDYNDHANWSGGIIGVGALVGTKYGITTLDMPGAVIKDITPDMAIGYYAAHYWKTLYAQIDDQNVANKLFDMGVLFGVGTAVRILQLSLEISEDGVFGPNTLAAVNLSDPTSLLTTYKANLVTHAFNIGAANPAERSNVADWGRRINS